MLKLVTYVVSGNAEQEMPDMKNTAREKKVFEFNIMLTNKDIINPQGLYELLVEVPSKRHVLLLKLL